MCVVGYEKCAKNFELMDKQNCAYINENRFEYLIVEKVDEIKFERFGKTTNYMDWDKGRLFGKQAELKWEKNHRGEFHIVIISDGSLPAGFSKFECDGLEKESKRKIFLWGKRDLNTSGWFDAQIPQVLDYPVSSSKSEEQLKIILYEYKFEEEFPELDGKVISRIYRFADIIQV